MGRALIATRAALDFALYAKPGEGTAGAGEGTARAVVSPGPRPIDEETGARYPGPCADSLAPISSNAVRLYDATRLRWPMAPSRYSADASAVSLSAACVRLILADCGASPIQRGAEIENIAGSRHVRQSY